MTELEIEAFLAIVKNGSISAAAQELYVTQPALSRRIGALEQELGYCLMNRKKGVRSIELTREGKAFISLAEKWREMWNETRQIGTLGSRQSLHIGSVGSISTYLLPEALAGFMEQNPDCPLVFRQYHSGESYEHVEKEEVDLAFISDDMYSHSVDTVPFFSGKMVLLATDWREKTVRPSDLDPQKEIRLPWNPEYDMWHDYWFGPGARARVLLDQMSLMEYFLREKGTWVILPDYIARSLSLEPGWRIHELEEGPPDTVIYYLVKKDSIGKYVSQFLETTRQVLSGKDGVNLLRNEGSWDEEKWIKKIHRNERMAGNDTF